MREAATICPRPMQVDLWPFNESRVTWATSVPILVFLGLSVLDLGPTYATDVRRETDRRQTDVRQHHRLMPPPRGRWHNNSWIKSARRNTWVYAESSPCCSLIFSYVAYYRWITRLHISGPAHSAGARFQQRHLANGCRVTATTGLRVEVVKRSVRQPIVPHLRHR